MQFALRSQDEKSWKVFVRKFRAEMNKPEPAKILDLLAALSHQTGFSLGCYCEDEKHCHRSILRQLLAEREQNFPEIPGTCFVMRHFDGGGPLSGHIRSL